MISEYEKPRVRTLARSIMNEYRAALSIGASESLRNVVDCLYAVDRLQTSQAIKDAITFAELCYDILARNDYSFFATVAMSAAAGMQVFYDTARTNRTAIRAGAQEAARIIIQDYAAPVINDYFRAMGEEPYQFGSNGKVSRRVSQAFHPDVWSDYDITPDEHGFVEQAFKHSFIVSEIIGKYSEGDIKEVLLAYIEIDKIRAASRDYIPRKQAIARSAARKRKEDKRKAKEEPKKGSKNNGVNEALEKEMEQVMERLVRSKLELARDEHYFAMELMFGHDTKYSPIRERVQGAVRKAVDSVYDSIYSGFEGYKREAEKKAAETIEQGGQALKYADLFEETGNPGHLTEALNQTTLSAEEYAEAFERTGDIRFIEEALKALKD